MQNPPEPSGKQRISSIDILRGAIMLIMAIDHCRDFLHYQGPSPTNIATTTPILFFTRWITHYCAPTFVFLSGVSAYLAGTRRTKNELTAFLIKRGLWLILIELTVLSFGFSLDPSFPMWVLEVIWVIGFSMIILGVLSRTSLTVIGIVGGLIFFGHNVLDYIALPQTGIASVLWKLFFNCRATIFPLGPHHFIFDLYAILPWTGVMLLGYVFGSMYKSSFGAPRRRKILLIAGTTGVILFLVLRFINLYGDPAPWSVQRSGVYTFLSFLNATKQPPSLQYLCMILGPALMVLAIAEHVQNKLTDIFRVYGNVPFFYFVLHFYFIRLIQIVLFFASGYHTSQIRNADTFGFTPPGFGYSLKVVYLIWLFVIVALYWPCKWYGNYKRTHHYWWLSYL